MITMKVWVISEHDYVEEYCCVVSVWGTLESAKRERERLKSACYFGVEYEIEEFEVEN